MTRNEMTAAINETRTLAGDDLFHGDYHAVFAISNDELDRILDRATSAAEFQSIWENETWWTDNNN